MSITVASLHIYPLKSGRGVAMPELRLTPRGPENDRLWMVVQADGGKAGTALTQRDPGCAKMALIETVPGHPGTAAFTAPGAAPLKITSLTPNEAPVFVWGSP